MNTRSSDRSAPESRRWTASRFHGERKNSGHVYFAVQRDLTRVTTLATDEAEFLELCAMFSVSDTTLKPWTTDASEAA